MSHFGPNLDLLGPHSGCQIFFKNLALSVTRYHGQLSSCTIEKTDDPILGKFSDMDGWTDRQTDDSDFLGSCPNVWHLI